MSPFGGTVTIFISLFSLPLVVPFLSFQVCFLVCVCTQLTFCYPSASCHYLLWRPQSESHHIRLNWEHWTAVADRVGSGSGKQLAALADCLAGPEALGMVMFQAVLGSDSTSKPLLAAELGV